MTKNPQKYLGFIAVSAIAVALIVSVFPAPVSAEEITGNLNTGLGLQSGVGGTAMGAPTASPAAGTYTSNQSVTLTAAGSDSIHYTTSGVAPTCASGTTYSGAIPVSSTVTIKAISCYPSSQSSSVASFTYTLQCAIAAVSNGTVDSYPSCAIACNQGYTLSGNFCAVSGGGGGGGGGGGYYPAPTPTPTPQVIGQATVTALGGGSATATSVEGGTANATFPGGAVSADAQLTITPMGSAQALVGAPPAGSFMVGGFVYQFNAVINGQTITSFSQPVTLTFTYTDAQAANFEESTLTVYYWDTVTAQWVVLPTTVNAVTNTVSVATTHFTYFAIIGKKKIAAVTPTPTPAGKPISEMTVEELKAQIADLQLLLLNLQSQLAKPAAFAANLYYGLKGNSEAKRLQEFLISKGFLQSGLNTGNYFTLTVEAVRNYQIVKGITPPAGYFGPKTRTVVNAELAQKAAGELNQQELNVRISETQADILEYQAESAKRGVKPAAFAANLYYGLKGNSEAKRLQEFLISKGFLQSGLNTGNYFALTVKAVRSYQIAKGITPSVGYFGPKTRAAVNAEL